MTTTLLTEQASHSQNNCTKLLIGVRDYIHVVDLAKGHLAAFEVFDKFGFHAFNLGTGTGTSVLQIVEAFRKESGQEIKTEFAPRRDGDVAWMWCSPGFTLIR